MLNTGAPRKMALLNTFALLAVLALVGLFTRSPSPSEPLYELTFSKRDVAAVCEVLSRDCIAHKATTEGIVLVDPARLSEARAAVADASLPRDPMTRVHKLMKCAK